MTKNHIAKTIEVAYEGYPDYIGELLKTHFKSSSVIKALLQKGHILQLEESLEVIKHDELQGQAQTRCFVRSLSQLGEAALAEYIYLFQESDKTWYRLEDG